VHSDARFGDYIAEKKPKVSIPSNGSSAF
jgi:hypothetical protein